MRGRVPVAELMTGQAIIVGASTWFKELARLMVESDSRCILITGRRGELTGIVTDADLLLKACRREIEGRPAANETRNRRADRRRAGALRAEDLMSSPVVTVSPTADALEAAELMLRHRVRQLVVALRRGQPMGVLSRRDLLRSLIRDDEKVDADLHDLLSHDLRSRANQVDISVDDGMVTVVDRLHDPRALAPFLRDATRVEGATAVRHVERSSPPPEDPGDPRP